MLVHIWVGGGGGNLKKHVYQVIQRQELNSKQNTYI